MAAGVNPTSPLGRSPIGAERQHYRGDGLVKIGYPDKGVAKRIAKSPKSHGEGGAKPDVYRCPVCWLWHHGHTPTKARP